jgi:hypothetical protein
MLEFAGEDIFFEIIAAIHPNPNCHTLVGSKKKAGLAPPIFNRKTFIHRLKIDINTTEARRKR